MTIGSAIAVLLIIGALFLLSRLYKTPTQLSTTTTDITNSVSAFSKLSEAEGKLVALKAAADVKKAEALAVHASLDEVHNILG